MTTRIESAPARTLDVEQLDALSALQVPGEPDIVTEMVTMFMEEADARLRDARAALERCDADGLRRCGHTLRGACSMLGAERLGAAAGRLEEGALQEQPDLAPLVAALAREWEALKTLLQPYLARTEERIQ